AFDAARNAGVIVAAASGNDDLDLDVRPRQPFSYGFDNIYGVAAYSPARNPTAVSNYGATTVDIAAPGVHNVTTAIPAALTVQEEDFENFTGTGWSFSAGSWQVADDLPETAKSLHWISGSAATAVWNDTVDMRNNQGGLLRFHLNFQPGAQGNAVYIDVRP